MTDVLIKRAYRLIDAARNVAKHHSAINNLECVQLHTFGYSEPGYSGDIIATGNWNVVGNKYDQDIQKFSGGDNTLKRLAEALDRIGVKTEWEDEWSSCCECGKLVRSSPDSYSWKPSYAILESSIICRSCIDPEEYLRHLENNPSSCNSFYHIDPANYSYIKVGEYEHGFYPGQNDDPKRIFKELQEKGHDRIIFNMDRVGQFDQRFSAWVYSDSIDVGG